MIVEKTKSGRIVGYDNIRIWATFLVLLGHSLVFSLGKGDLYGAVIGLQANKTAEILRQFIYSFHMPLFVMLSGAVFSMVFKKENALNWSAKRLKKMLIPYFGVALFLLIPVRLLVGYYGKNPDYLHILFNDVLLSMDVNLLWYVVMLAEVTIIMSLIFCFAWPKKKSGYIILLVIFIVLSAMKGLVSNLPFQISRTFEFLLWFYIGMLFQMFPNRLLKYIKSTMFYVSMFIGLVGSFAVSYFLGQKQLAVAGTSVLLIIKILKAVLSFVATGCGCWLFFGLAFGIHRHNNVFTSWIGNRSFQIYLYQVPCMYLFTWLGYYLVPNSKINDALLCLLLVGRFIAGLLGAFLIDKIVCWCKSLMQRKGKIAQ